MHRNGNSFLPETQEENSVFGVHITKNVGVIYEIFSSFRRFDRDNFAPIVGFQNNEVGCPYFQVFPHVRELLIIPTGIIDNSRIFRVNPKKGIFFPCSRQKSGHFCACMRKKYYQDS